MKIPEAINDAWGLELGGSSLRLVHVTATAVGYSADKLKEYPVKADASPAELAAAASQLAAQAPLGRLAITLPDRWILHRSLTVPRADHATTEKLVASQLEVLLPTQFENFQWRWAAHEDPFQPQMQRVLLCAARKDCLEPLVAAAARLADEQIFIPAATALGRAWPLFAHSKTDSLVLLDVAAGGTSLAIIHHGNILQCGMVDQGGDHWTSQLAQQAKMTPQQARQWKVQYRGGESDNPQAAQVLAEQLGKWAHQVAELYHDCLADIPRKLRPEKCLLLGRASVTFGLAEAAAQALQLQVQPAATPSRLSLAADVPFDSAATAIAAAVCILEKDGQKFSLASQLVPRRRRLPKIPRRWAVAAGWLAVAIMSLYLLDIRESNWLDDATSRIRTKVAGSGTIEQQLAVMKYLEKQGPSLLSVLEELSFRLPEKAILQSLRYNRSGELTINGTVPADQDLQDFLARLSQSPLVLRVEPGTTRMENGKISFEVSLKIGTTSKSTSRPAATAASASATTAASISDAGPASHLSAAGQSSADIQLPPVNQSSTAGPSSPANQSSAVDQPSAARQSSPTSQPSTTIQPSSAAPVLVAPKAAIQQEEAR